MLQKKLGQEIADLRKNRRLTKAVLDYFNLPFHAERTSPSRGRCPLPRWRSKSSPPPPAPGYADRLSAPPAHHPTAPTDTLNFVIVREQESPPNCCLSTLASVFGARIGHFAQGNRLTLLNLLHDFQLLFTRFEFLRQFICYVHPLSFGVLFQRSIVPF